MQDFSKKDMSIILWVNSAQYAHDWRCFVLLGINNAIHVMYFPIYSSTWLRWQMAEHNYMCAILVIIKLLGKNDPHQTIIKVFLWIRIALIANGPTDILNQISDSKYLNILRPDRNCRHFANDISKNFLKRKLFWFKLRWCLFLKVQLIKSALVQVIE